MKSEETHVLDKICEQKSKRVFFPERKEFIKYYFFPFLITNLHLNENNQKDHISEFLSFLEKKENIKKHIEQKNLNLIDLYVKEKQEIKNKGYTAISSFTNFCSHSNSSFLEELENFIVKNRLKSLFFFDYFCYNKMIIFVHKESLSVEIDFILKNINLFNFLNHKALLKYNKIKFVKFSSFNNFDTLTFKEKKDFSFFLKEKIKKLNLIGDIFVLSDCFFCIDEKKLSYLLLSL